MMNKRERRPQEQLSLSDVLVQYRGRLLTVWYYDYYC